MQNSLLVVIYLISNLQKVQKTETYVRKEREVKENEMREERKKEPHIIQVIKKRDNLNFE